MIELVLGEEVAAVVYTLLGLVAVWWAVVCAPMILGAAWLGRHQGRHHA